MPSIVKPLSGPFNITSSANTVSDANLVSVTNTGTDVEFVTVQETSGEVAISPGATIYIEKDPSHNLDSSGANSAIWATSIAYRA